MRGMLRGCSFISVGSKRNSGPRSSLVCGFISVCRYLVGLQGRNTGTVCTETEQNTHTHKQTIKMCLHAKSGIITHCSSVRVIGDCKCLGTCDHFNRYEIFSIKFSCTTCERIVWAKELLIFQIHSNHFKILDTVMLAWNKFLTEYPQILNTTINIWTPRRPGTWDLCTPGLGPSFSGMSCDTGWAMVTEVSGHTGCW